MTEQLLNRDRQKILSSQEAAKLFGVTNDYVARLCRQGKLQGVLEGRMWYVRRESLEAFFGAPKVAGQSTAQTPAEFISSREAAHAYRVSNDYIARLCRQGKVAGELRDRVWYAEKKSLAAFFGAAIAATVETPATPVLVPLAPAVVAAAQPASQKSFVFPRTALAFVVGALFAVSGVAASMISPVQQEAALARVESPFFFSFGDIVQKFAALFTPKAPAVATETPAPVVVVVPQASAVGAAASTSVANTYVTNTYPVTERVVERTTTTLGDTSSFVARTFFNAQIDRIFDALGDKGEGGGSSVDFSDLTISDIPDLSSLYLSSTGTTTTTGLTISTLDCSLFGNGGKLTTDALGNVVCDNDNGSGGVSWGSITGTLSAQSDLQNALNAKLNASSYGTQFYTYFSATTTDALAQGSTNRYYDNALVLSYLNTLDKGYFFATSSADYWKTQNNFFSTTSASYFSSLGLAFSTTSADYLLSTKNYATQAQLFAYPFPSNATSTAITFNGGLSTTYASTTALSATSLCLVGDSCITTWPSGGGGGGSFDYPFPSSATTTFLSFNGGLSATNIGIGTTSPQALLDIAGSSINNGIRVRNSNNANVLDIFNDGDAHLETTPGSSLWINQNNNAPTDIGNSALRVENGAGVSVGNSLTIGSLNGLLKASSGFVSVAIPGGDYVADTTGDWAGSFNGQGGDYYLEATNLNNFSIPFDAAFAGKTTDDLTEGAANKYFHTSLVQDYLDTLDLGYFFSTTSAEYLLSTKDFFSTTSAEYLLSTKGLFSYPFPGAATSTQLAFTGGILISGAGQISFGDGSYGIRDNGGTLEFKNTGGDWKSFINPFAVDGSQNIFAGASAFASNVSGTYNVAFGYSALNANTSGGSNIALGLSALQTNQTGSSNVAIGGDTLHFNTSGAGNTGVGAGALAFVNGNNNVGIGAGAGDNLISGNNNIAIGANIDVPDDNGSDQLMIGNLIYGDMANVQLGIATNSNLNGALTVNGAIGTQSEGDIFRQYDADDAAWYPVFARYNTNHGTFPGGTYIFGSGANANVGIEQPGGLNIDSFHVKADESTFNGSVGVNMASPTYTLDVNGSIRTNSYLIVGSNFNIYDDGEVQISSNAVPVNFSGASKYNFANGNVGIDVGNPTAKLDVNGSINGASLNVYDSGTFTGTITSGGTILAKYDENDLSYTYADGALTVNSDGVLNFAYASTTALSASTICISADCRSAWPSAGSSFAYPFPSNATSTPVAFNGGLTAQSLAVQGTGTSTFAGGISIAGSIVPTTDNTYSLGTADKMWRDVYIGPGSLYINGKKVIEEDSDDIVVSADTGQNLIIETTGTGDVELHPTGTGLIQLKANVMVSAGKTFNTTDNSAVMFTNGVRGGNVALSGNELTALNTSGSISLVASSTGGVYVPQGNFGIATTAPLAKFDVYGNAILSGTNRYLNFGAESGSGGYGVRDNAGTLEFKNFSGSWTAFGAGSSSFAYPFPSNATSTLLAFNGGLTASTVTTAGNVGVATTSPWAPLSIHINNGSTNTTAFAIGSSTASATTTIFRITNSGGVIAAGPITATANTTNGSALALTRTDNSSQKAAVVLTPAGTITTSNRFWNFGMVEGQNSFDMWTFDSSNGVQTWMRILNTGEVGIGSTTPAAKLSVAGNTYITGGLGVGLTNTSAGTLRTSGNATIGGNFTAQQATTTSLAVTSLLSSLLKTDASGNVVAAVAGADYLTAANVFAYPFPSNATSTLLAFNGGLTSFASTTIGNGTQAGGLTIAGGATTTGAAYFAGNVGVGTTSPGSPLSIKSTGANQVVIGYDDSNYAALNVLSTGQLSINTSNTAGISFVTAGSSRMSISNLGLIAVNSAGALISPNSGLSSTVPNIVPNRTDTTTGFAAGTSGNINVIIAGTEMARWTSAGLGIGTSSPYSKLSVAGQVVGQNFVSTSTTAINSLPLLTATTATTSNLAVTGVVSALLKTNTLGQVVAAVAGTDYQAAGNYSTFAYPFPSSATSTALSFSGGLTAYASTTIGSGTGTGGLTISGNATTTGRSIIGGILSFINPTYTTTLDAEGLDLTDGFSAATYGYAGISISDIMSGNSTNVDSGDVAVSGSSAVSHIYAGYLSVDTFGPGEDATLDGDGLVVNGAGGGLLDLSVASGISFNPEIGGAFNLADTAFLQSGPGSSLLLNGDAALNGATNLTLKTGGTEFARLTSVGNLGIGSTTPWKLLSVGSNNAGTFAISTSTAGCAQLSASGELYSTGSGCGTAVLTGTQGQVAYFSGTNTAVGTSSLYIATSGKVGLGTTTPRSLLGMDRAFTGTAPSLTVAGLDQIFSTAMTGGATVFGNSLNITNSPSGTANTLAGSIIRINDSTSLSNTVRGLEVQANRGTNTQGENTGVSAFGRTFGVKGTTEGDAGALFVPAGVYAETRGTTQGNALRAYSGSITSSDLFALVHDTSTFSGNALLVDMASTTGTFTGNLLNLRNGGTSRLVVTGAGNVGVGTTTPWKLLSVGANNSGTFAISTSTAGCAQFSGSGELYSTGSNCGSSGSLTGTAGQVAYFSGANIAVGTSSLVISTAGNVGIGTTTPSDILTVQSAASSVGRFVSSNVAGAQLNLTSYDTGGGTWRLISTGSSNATGANAFSIYSNTLAGYAFTIRPDGRAGVGTTSPFARMSVDTSSLAASVPSFVVGSSTRTDFLINQAGNVGIGVMAPGAKLDVAGNIWVRNAVSTGAVANISAGAAGNGISIESSFASGGYGPTVFTNGGAEVARITAAGNVGIGTTTPLSGLTVTGAGFSTTNMTNDVLVYMDAAGGNYGRIQVANAGNSVAKNLILNPAGGDVGIGTVSNLKRLTIRQSSTNMDGGIAIQAADGINYGVINTDPSNNLAFGSWNGSIFQQNLTINKTTGALTAASLAGTGTRCVQTDSSGVLSATGSTCGAGGGINGTTGQVAYFSGTNAAVGTSTLFIATSGNVGVGTTSPLRSFTVEGNSNINIIGARAQNFSNGSAAQARFEAAADGAPGTAANGALATYSSGNTISAFGLPSLANYSLLFTEGSNSNGLIVGTATAKPLIFGTNTTERARFDSAGNLGIGTTSPYAKLSVDGLPDGSDGVVFKSTGRPYVNIAGGINNYKTLRFSDPGALYRWDINVAPNNDANANNLSFWNPTAGQMFVLNQNGNVGIGTTSPDQKLVVSGSTNAVFKLEKTAATAKNWYMSNSLAATNAFSISDETAYRFTIDTSGNVGVGTTSLVRSLVVAKQNSSNWIQLDRSSNSFETGIQWTTGTTPDFYFGQRATAPVAGLHLYDYTKGSDVFVVEPNANMYFVPTSNVGIGTTSPYGKLSVVGGSAQSAAVFTSVGGSAGAGPGTIQLVNNDNNSYNWAISATCPSLTSGNVCTQNVGVAPSANNSGYMGYRYSSSGSTANALTWGFYANDQLMTLQATGNLGIGTTTPYSMIESTGSGLALSKAVPYLTLQSTNTGAEFTTFVGGDAVYFEVAGDATAADNKYVFRTRNAAGGYATPGNRVTIAANGDLTIAGSGGTCTITGSGSCTSDARLKEHLAPISGADALEKLARIQSVTFDWINPELDQRTRVGVLAQDVLKAFPELVSTSTMGVYGDVPEYYMVDTAGLTSPLIAAVNELNIRLDSLATTTSATTDEPGSFASAFFTNLKKVIGEWLSNAGNGIASIFAETVTATVVHAQDVKADNTVCVGAECFTEDDVRALLELVRDQEPEEEPQEEEPQGEQPQNPEPQNPTPIEPQTPPTTPVEPEQQNAPEGGAPAETPVEGN